MTDYKIKYNQEIVPALKKEFAVSSILALPKIQKVTINSGVGRDKEIESRVEEVIKELTLISGQKPRINKSRKSISGFKLREGQIVGISVTLRGQRMYDFLQRFVTVALPRIRDFRGLTDKSFDKQGNFSIGLKEQTIFPEIKTEGAKEAFGLQVNVSISGNSKEQSKKLLELFGFPFEKANLSKKEQNGS